MNKYVIPISIIIAGALVGASIYFSNTKKPVENQPQNPTGQTVTDITPISDKDHIMGNPDAPVVIVEYSDIQCPFCGQMHETMNKIMSEYGKDGKVAWVYRHYPLDSIHPKARRAAEATECVSQVAGEDAFWKYLNALFASQKTNVLDDAELTTFAQNQGVDVTKFTSCLNAGGGKEAVQSDYVDGNKLAATDPQFGTPYNILLTKDGQKIVIRGARPYDNLKQGIDSLLAETK